MSDFHATDYWIENTFSKWGMMRRARKLMKDGWKPNGGIIKSFGMYYQSFVKYSMPYKIISVSD